VQNINEESKQVFLTAAASASWFNNSFDYRTVARWCGIPEAIGMVTLDALVATGLILKDTQGHTGLTDAGRLSIKLRGASNAVASLAK
jgi:hypothetical protein